MLDEVEEDVDTDTDEMTVVGVTGEIVVSCVRSSDNPTYLNKENRMIDLLTRTMSRN